MPAVEVLPTGSEPLRRLITEDGGPHLGATVRCDVRRSGDGLVLDFADVTFKAVGAVGTRYRVLSEVSAVDWPGLYEGGALDLSGIVGGVAVGDVLTVTYYETSPTAMVLDQDELRVVAAAATAVQISDVVRAGITTDHGNGSYLTANLTGLAQEATLAAMKGATFDTATDSLEALRDRGDAAWITATGFATPTNVTEGVTSTLAGIVSAHGAGSYITAVVAGLATGADVAAGTAAVEVYGDLNWATATGFATPGAEMTLSDGALLPAKIGAGFVASMQANLALEATLTAIKGASWDGGTDSLRAIRVLVSAIPTSSAPTAADNATAVWAKAFGTPDAGTFGWLLYRLGQWGTELCQKRIVGQNLLLQSIGGGITYVSVPLKDVSGGLVAPSPGEPAQFLP